MHMAWHKSTLDGIDIRYECEVNTVKHWPLQFFKLRSDNAVKELN